MKQMEETHQRSNGENSTTQSETESQAVFSLMMLVLHGGAEIVLIPPQPQLISPGVDRELKHYHSKMSLINQNSTIKGISLI